MKPVKYKPQRKFWHSVFEKNSCLICPLWCRESHSTLKHLNVKFRNTGGCKKFKSDRHFFVSQKRSKNFKIFSTQKKIFVAENFATNDFLKFCRFYRDSVKPAPIKVTDYDAGAKKISKFIGGKQNSRKISEKILRNFGAENFCETKKIESSRNFAIIPQHFRPTGLHGLHKNADALTCPLCFLWFLDDFSFCSHFENFHIKFSNFPNFSNVQNLPEKIRSISTVIRNESNLPPDLGNGYRLPLFIVESCAEATACTLCGLKFVEKTFLYRHLIECGNQEFQNRS